MSLRYEPSSESLIIYVKQLFSNYVTCTNNRYDKPNYATVRGYCIGNVFYFIFGH